MIFAVLVVFGPRSNFLAECGLFVVGLPAGTDVL